MAAAGTAFAIQGICSVSFTRQICPGPTLTSADDD